MADFAKGVQLAMSIPARLYWRAKLGCNLGCYASHLPSPRSNAHDEPQPTGILRESMTSSTIPEVHNVSQRSRRRTEPRPRATCKER